ncbi:MAG TPA: hypothetical protein VHQ47_17910 [Phycisphaerae bacterium]|jgi:hypothetical protein|nr:hypothetical protein [Phycisphaerae bacterium]
MAAATTPVKSYANKLYYCLAGIGGTPTWVEITEAENVTVTHTFGESDVTTRGAGGVKQSEPVLQEITIEFNVPYLPGSMHFLALQGAAFARSLVGIAAMSDDIANDGAEGVWADCKIFGMPFDEPIDKHVDIKITLKPCYSTNAATWQTTSA